MEPEADPILDQVGPIGEKLDFEFDSEPKVDIEASSTPPLGSSPPNLDESSSVSLTEPNDVRSDSEDVFSDGEDYDYVSSSEDELHSEDEAPLMPLTLPPVEEPKLFSQIKDITVDVLDLTEQQTESSVSNDQIATVEVFLVVDTFTATIQVRMPRDCTVESVKSALIKSQPPLFAFEPKDLSLGLSADETFDNPSAPFVECHPLVHDMFNNDEYIVAVAFPEIQKGKIDISLPARKTRKDKQNRMSVANAMRLSELFLKPNVLKEGILGKKMQFSQKFEPRLVELRNDHNLYYYKVDPLAPPGTEPQLLGKLPLSISTVGRNPDKPEWFTFTCGTKVVLWQGDSAAVVTEWVDILSRMIGEAKWAYSADIEYEGYLTKKGEKVKNWKRRWCVLKQDHIFYYENQQIPRVDPLQFKGKISLYDCIVSGDSEKSFGFKIHTRDRTYFLEAKDVLEARRWVKSIHICRKRLKAIGLKGPGSVSPSGNVSLSKSGSLQRKASVLSSGVPLPSNQFPSFDYGNLPVIQRQVTLCSDVGESDVEIAQHLDLRKLKRMVDDDQCRFTRQYYFYLRRMVAADRDPVGHMLAPAPTATTPLPSDFPDHVDATFHFQELSVTIKANILLSFRAAVIDCMTRMQKRALVATDVAVDDFVVQIFGRRLHVVDLGLPLAALAWVRHRVCRGNKKLEFLIVKRNDIAMAVYGSAASFYAATRAARDDAQRRVKSSKASKMRKMVNRFKRVLEDSSQKEKARSNSIRDLNVLQSESSPVKEISTRPSADIRFEKGFSVYHLDDLPFSVRVLSIENFSHSFLASFYASQGVDAKEGLASKLNFYMEVGLFYAGQPLGPTTRSSGKLTPFWGETLVSSEPIRTLPPETRVCFTFWCSLMQQSQPLAWVNCTLADYTGALKRGSFKLPMWLVDSRHLSAAPVNPNSTYTGQAQSVGARLAQGTATCDVNALGRLVLHLEFPSPPMPVVFPDFSAPRFATSLKRPSRMMESAPASPQSAAAARTATRPNVTKSGQHNARFTAQLFGQSNYNAQYEPPSGLKAGVALAPRQSLTESRSRPASTDPSSSTASSASSTSSSSLSDSVSSMSRPPVSSTETLGEDSFGADEASRHLNSLPRARMRTANRPQLHRVLMKDPLHDLSESEREMIWGYRKQLAFSIKALPKLFASADMRQPEHRDYIHRIAMNSQLLPPEQALQLLDFKYADSVVRSYAVQCMDQCSDTELCLYALQLVQALKFEPFHTSALESFLVERALHAPLTVGHALLWHLQAEMHIPEVQARFGLLKEAILLGMPLSMRKEFLEQVTLVGQLARIQHAIAASSATTPQQRVAILRQALSELELPPKFSLPLSSSMVVKGLMIDSCKVLDSSAFPFWLVFENIDAGADPVIVLFKVGDDLRQDVLTLQMFTYMDTLWKEAGLDMQMSVYGCVATGDSCGLIEVVADSQTTAKIQKEAGGVMGALKKTPIHDWLLKNNSDEAAWKRAQNTFVATCAAYCVATYVVGLGDRHNDNIMITKHGHLFHIDFAHFLGNVMKFGIYTRERAPFVFTPDFLFVMGGEQSSNYASFRDLCCRCYNILRTHANTFISLFAMMLRTGLPQLNSADDLSYLRRAFSTNLSTKQADDTFKRLIDESLQSKSTQINFTFHILAHLD